MTARRDDSGVVHVEIREVADVACAFVAAKVALEGSDSGSMLERTVEVDRCWHELKRVCGYGDEEEVQL